MATSIAVVGAGPGGLTAARILQERGRDVTVYDLEASPTERSQGGTLDLHEETGQRAIELAGLTDDFARLARPEGESVKVVDSAGHVAFETAGVGGDKTRPEIDREDLRDLLISSLDPDRIVWGKKLSQLDVSGDVNRLQFSDGSNVEADVVIGADGTWSKVRQAVSSVAPVYAGITFVDLVVHDVDRQHPDIADYVGQGSLFAMASDRAIIAQRNGKSRIRTYYIPEVPESWADLHDSLDWEQGDQVRELVLSECSGWSRELLALVESSSGEAVLRPIYAMPVGHRWSRVPGVTLLGDAAHVMSPFGGFGANLAMADGADLALALTDQDDVEVALQEYETTMFGRGAQFAGISAAILEQSYGADAPQGLARLMRQLGEAQD